MLGMLRRLIGEDINLSWKPGAGLWTVKVDPTQIDQILANLCVNARDAIDGVGRITIRSENCIVDEAHRNRHPGFAIGEYVVLTVSDDGCGIGKDALDQIFEPFYTTKTVGEGTGLGLATVYGIVKQNDGFIDVHSEPDRGSTFKIYLPRSGDATVKARTPAATTTPAGKGETVLLVEDEADVLEVGRELLEELGYQVLTAGKPSEAIGLAEAHAAKLRLLITDVVMPEMNGRELAQQIQTTIPGLKCLFTSGYTTDVIAHHGILHEDVNFLHKPFSLDDLAGKLQQVLESD
jgi:two-component system sensor histidine kinase EvgS